MKRLATAAVALLVTSFAMQDALAAPAPGSPAPAHGAPAVPPPKSTTVPKQMLHVSVKVTDPKPEPNSYGAQPKEYWSAGSHYLRTAEAPDPKQKLHQLFIINTPDIWVIEQFTKRAQHVTVSKDLPAINAIFGGNDPVGKKTMRLQYGTEVQFFKDNKATVRKTKDAHGAPADKYSVKIEDAEFVLLTQPGKEHPLSITKTQKGQSNTLEYVVFERIPFDKSLFELPKGLTVVEAHPAQPKLNKPVSIPAK